MQNVVLRDYETCLKSYLLKYLLTYIVIKYADNFYHWIVK